MKRRIPKGRTPHFGIFINSASSHYHADVVTNLTNRLDQTKAYYTIYEPGSAMELLKEAEAAAGVNSTGEMNSSGGANINGRNRKFTALVACGGDGTFNLVSRAAIRAGLPVGILPLGRLNNIARSLYGSDDPDAAIDRILKGEYRQIDMGNAAGQTFFGSVGIGFVPSLARELKSGSVPRYGIGWSKIGSRSVASLSPRKMVIKVDSFKYEVSPLIFNVNLLSYSAGLPLSPASMVDDGQAEVLFDKGESPGEFSSFTRLIYKRKYLYGSKIKLYRAKEIHCHPVKGKELYLDGEFIRIPTDSLEIRVSDIQLKVLC